MFLGPPVFDPARHDRRSMRLRTHDYASPGLYFVTFCTRHRHPWFGDLVAGEVRLNANGRTAFDHWLAIPGHYDHVAVHRFVIMPDHVHGLIELTARPQRSSVQRSGPRPAGPAPGSLGAVVGSFRAGVVREMNWIRPYVIRGLWQRGYHDIIIRDQRMTDRITAYIARHPRMIR